MNGKILEIKSFLVSRFFINSGWNMMGQIVPLFAALFSIPVLINNIGNDKFGFLTIAWMLIGYFSLFDFGIGKALTHAVSKRLSNSKITDISDLIWTGLTILVFIGVVVGSGILYFSEWIVSSFIIVPDEIKIESIDALFFLSFSIPFVILSTGLRGILEASQEFKAINLVMMPVGAFLFLGPAFTSQISSSLSHAVLSLVVVRLFSSVMLLTLCVVKVECFRKANFKVSVLKELLGLGGWMTVTNVASPIMANMDRVFIGSQISLSAVSYYSIPFDIVSKLLVVPSSIAGVCFPYFSRFSELDKDHIKKYFIRAVAFIFFVISPLVLFFCYFSYDLLRIWISEEVAINSSEIMKILAVGMLINGISYIPFSFIQGIGRSDVTAKFHLFELMIYLPVLFFMIEWYGGVGVAFAWVFRVLVDAILLFSYAFFRLKEA